MTKIFFEELQQTAKIMLRLEKILQKQKLNLVIVPGDTNSTLAEALTATKLHIPVAHIEAGARSYDIKMPEEKNRRLTDHCSTVLFTPAENCTKNLIKEEIKITKTGGTILLLQRKHRQNLTLSTRTEPPLIF